MRARAWPVRARCTAHSSFADQPAKADEDEGRERHGEIERDREHGGLQLTA
jgi:hypothetical protein